ncbi:uncharacterized protein TRUGW13939_02215 [Talaromyces rugulosus]|uniref:Uncharacterized protein n=1 Tax=Talaromyces rugulosus TaxID=121627 RepID=A0A7H8QPP7_TALRU|nr:uncharacterized protein TRUGW13939_02215 [Talaromyces rugulosus]QKX55123.1 hypothetical protein TRUGW13939_02215 [Talaromyces rugulosus]
MGPRKIRSKKSEEMLKNMSSARNRLSMIPEDDTVTKPGTKNKDDKTQFEDVAASLNVLVGNPHLPQMEERPSSRRGHHSSLPVKSSLPGESLQQESSVASDAVRPWPQAFGGTPRGQSQPPPTPSAGTPRGRFDFRPVPFLNKGQVTYNGQTQFNTNISITIIWNDEKIWGQFTIDNGYGFGYIRAGMKSGWKLAKDGETVTFHWRGLGNGEKVPPGDMTKSKFKLLKECEEISGVMGPMDKHGRMNWALSKDGNTYLEAKKFKFSGVRQAKSEIDEEGAWKGWDIF